MLLNQSDVELQLARGDVCPCSPLGMNSESVCSGCASEECPTSHGTLTVQNDRMHEKQMWGIIFVAITCTQPLRPKSS